MPWCPKCKNEYVEGKTHCPDCDVDLVEKLTPEALTPYAEEIEIPEDYEFPEDFNPEEILRGPKEPPKMARTFKSARERYADVRSSAYTFLFLGTVGFVVMALALAGVYELPFHDFALWVMLLLFVVFLGIGFASLKNAKSIQSEITAEEEFIEKIRAWYQTEGCKQEQILNAASDKADEFQYFQLYDAIRRTLLIHFPEIDEALLDKLTSDFCEED